MKDGDLIFLDLKFPLISTSFSVLGWLPTSVGNSSYSIPAMLLPSIQVISLVIFYNPNAGYISYYPYGVNRTNHILSITNIFSKRLLRGPRVSLLKVNVVSDDAQNQ